METPATGQAPAASASTVHQHGAGCFWDHHSAAWACSASTASPLGQSAPSGRADGGAAPLVDVRDMVVVHTALLREFRLAPAAVARVPLGSRRSAARVNRHIVLLCDLLHHHHSGEDELLWPPLRQRLPHEAVQRLEQAEAQHAGLDAALERVSRARAAWRQHPGQEERSALVAELRVLHALLATHLDDEERDLLPLAAVHLSPAEWKAVGEAGAAALPKSVMPLVFGMFAYEGDPAVVTSMLAEAPGPVRVLIPHIAPRAYARRAQQLYGTATP